MERVESRLGTFGLEKSWNQLSRNPSHLRAAPALQIHCCTHCTCTLHIANYTSHTAISHSHCTLHTAHCNYTLLLHRSSSSCTDLAKSCSCCTFRNQSSLLCRCSFAATNGHLDSHFAAAYQKTTFLPRHPY